MLTISGAIHTQILSYQSATPFARFGTPRRSLMIGFNVRMSGSDGEMRIHSSDQKDTRQGIETSSYRRQSHAT